MGLGRANLKHRIFLEFDQNIVFLEIEEVLSIFDKETNKKILITGKKGTTIFFDQNKCLHAGLPTLKKDRIVLSFCLYPTLRKNIVYQTNKPLNAHHTLNPFTKIS